MKILTLGCVAALALPAVAMAAPEPKSIPFVDTGPFKHVDVSGPAREAQQKLLHQRNISSQSAGGPTTAVSRDEGNVVILVDNGSMIIQPTPANLYDLADGTAITFSPGVDSFSVSNSGLPMDGGIGAGLGLGDDDTTEVAIGFSFPFLGESYSSIHVNSDGNITLGSGDGSSTARTAGHLVSGPPRIAPLYVDLDPTSGGGSVNADVRGDRVVVTWTGVPQFGVGDSNTFQVVLHSDGTIDMVLQSVAASVGIVGVAEGGGEEPFNEVDISTDLPTTLDAGAIFEEFTPGIANKQIDTLAVANEFYKTHGDKYDFLVMFTDWVVDLDGGFAFHQGVQNLTFGLGNRGVFNSSNVAGSGGELESILMMNRIGLYWPDAKKLENPPIKKFRFSGAAASNGPPGPNQVTNRARQAGTLNGDFGSFGPYTLGLNSAMSIMAQEAGHRWLAFPLILHPTTGFSGDSWDLLGRADAHWSFFFNVTVPPSQFGGDPRASSEEGNAILDLGVNAQICPDMAAGGGVAERIGANAFQMHPNELIDGFTLLDQYMMGLLDSDDVGSFWYADNPTFSSGTSVEFAAGFGAQDDFVFCGNRVDLTVNDIWALNDFFGGGFPTNGPRFFLDKDNGFAPVFGQLGDEIDQVGGSGAPALDVKTMAFVLIVETDPGKKSSAVKQVDTFRKTWEKYGNGPATADLGRFDTSLDPDTY